MRGNVRDKSYLHTEMQGKVLTEICNYIYKKKHEGIPRFHNMT